MLKSEKFNYHYYSNNKIWASKGLYVYRKHIFDNSWQKYLKIDELPLFSNINLYNRLIRNGIHNIIPFNNNKFIVVIKNYILYYKNSHLKNKFKIIKGKRPLRQAILKCNKNLIYGEYWSNPEREKVNLIQIDIENHNQEKIISFNNARHIHFVQKDIFDKNNIFTGTGDKDEESGIYKYSIKRDILTKIGGGSQKWRAVSILQKDNYIYWGSDCPYKQNYIYRYNRNNRDLEKLYPIEGPAYYSTMNKSGKMFIATTIEDRKKHKAIIYESENGVNWNELIEFKKDIFPEKLFGYGLIEFIRGQEKLENLYVNLRGLKEFS